MAPSVPAALFAYLVLFAALYAGFGVQSPYLPRLLQEHGLGAEAIGVVLASGTAIRLAAGPVAGRIADRLDAARLVFAGCAAVAALAAFGYLPAAGFWPLLGITLLQASALAPLAPLGDSLALAAAAPHERGGRTGFDYGWVRGAGSGAFILGSVASGQAVDHYGLPATLWLNAALLVAAAAVAPGMPRLTRSERRGRQSPIAAASGNCCGFRCSAVSCSWRR
jgi:PPP family 3-phenylpropionic acid transporter